MVEIIYKDDKDLILKRVFYIKCNNKTPKRGNKNDSFDRYNQGQLKGNSGVTVGYRFHEVETGLSKHLSSPEANQFVAQGSCTNAVIENGKITPTDGSINSLPVVDAKRFLNFENKVLVVLGQYKISDKAVGYKVLFPDNRVQDVATKQLISFKEHGYYNAKVVTREGSEPFISAIKGSFTELQNSQNQEISAEQTEQTEHTEQIEQIEQIAGVTTNSFSEAFLADPRKIFTDFKKKSVKLLPNKLSLPIEERMKYWDSLITSRITTFNKRYTFLETIKIPEATATKIVKPEGIMGVFKEPVEVEERRREIELKITIDVIVQDGQVQGSEIKLVRLGEKAFTIGRHSIQFLEEATEGGTNYSPYNSALVFLIASIVSQTERLATNGGSQQVLAKRLEDQIDKYIARPRRGSVENPNETKKREIISAFKKDIPAITAEFEKVLATPSRVKQAADVFDTIQKVENNKLMKFLKGKSK